MNAEEETDHRQKAIFELNYRYNSTTPPPSYYPKPPTKIEWKFVIACGILVILGVLLVELFAH